jgi:hypothetical protein
LCLLLALLPVTAGGEESPLGWSYVDTRDLRLIYFDDLSYLAPHAVRTFTNSLAWQRRIFGWHPSEPTTELLKDLSDYGNASAGACRTAGSSSTRAAVTCIETYPASERMLDEP